MILKRDGREVDETTYVKTSDAMLRMQRVADRLIGLTPEISKFLPADSLLRTNKIQAIQAKNEATGKDLNARNLQKIRETTNGLPQIKAEMSSEDVRQRAMDIDQILEEQKSENERLKQDLENRKDRYVLRELEYRKIIEDLQNEIRQKTVLDINEARKMEPTTKYHQEILDRIGKLQVKTSHVLVDQEKTVIRFFNDKISEIKKQFEEERIKKGKKDQDYIQRENQLISELEWIENIAQKIDNENINLMKKFMDLQAQYQTQENDRDLLLKELIMKKKQNAILKSQIENYEKMLNQVQKEEEEENQQEEDEANEQDAAKQYANEQDTGKQQALRINNLNQSQKLQQDQMSNSSQKSKNMHPENVNGRIKMTKSTNYSNEIMQFLKRNEIKIKEAQMQLKQEQKRIRDLKQLYVKELLMKSELEKIIRKCVEDVKENIIQLKGENRVGLNSTVPDHVKEKRDQFIDKLISNEKIITLIYDKTFYPETKNIDINLSSDQIDQDVVQIRQSQLKNRQNTNIQNQKYIDNDDHLIS